jgi:hypothetical protein
MYSLPNIIRDIKSRIIRWAGNVARVGDRRGAYRILVGRPCGVTIFKSIETNKLNLIVQFDFRDYSNVTGVYSALDSDIRTLQIVAIGELWNNFPSWPKLKTVNLFDCYSVSTVSDSSEDNASVKEQRMLVFEIKEVRKVKCVWSDRFPRSQKTMCTATQRVSDPWLKLQKLPWCWKFLSPSRILQVIEIFLYGHLEIFTSKYKLQFSIFSKIIQIPLYNWVIYKILS